MRKSDHLVACWSLVVGQGVIELISFAWVKNWPIQSASEMKIEYALYYYYCLLRVRVCMPINRRICQSTVRIPIWLSTFDSQNIGEERRSREKKHKIIDVCKTRSSDDFFEIGYKFMMVFYAPWHSEVCFWIKQMHQSHSGNMNLKSELPFRSFFDLDCLLSWACQSQQNILFDINMCVCCILFGMA